MTATACETTYVVAVNALLEKWLWLYMKWIRTAKDLTTHMMYIGIGTIR